MTNPQSIRKAAILVSLVDTRSADALLEGMGPQLAAQVRQAVMELEDVPPEEEQHVLADFLHRDAAMEGADDHVEIERSRSEAPCEPLPQHAISPQPPAAPRPPLRFLLDVEPARVAEALTREHPQTVAVVVAQLTPEHAGRVLERLPTSLATEALGRMAYLAEPVDGVLEELARELERRLGPYTPPAGGPSGVANVQAILASLPGGHREQIIERMSRQDKRLASRLKVVVHDPNGDARENNTLSLRYRLECQASNQEPPEIARQSQSPPLLDFEDLDLLSQRDLERLAGAASGQLLSLALIEADERLTRRLLRGLPDAEKAEIRHRLASPGPIRLRDIDDAQRQLADLARRLAREEKIALPISRRFAAAA